MTNKAMMNQTASGIILPPDGYKKIPNERDYIRSSSAQS